MEYNDRDVDSDSSIAELEFQVDSKSVSPGVVGDQAVSGAVVGADTRSPREALLDAVALANIWGWAEPLGVGAAVRSGSTTGNVDSALSSRWGCVQSGGQPRDC